MNRLMDVSNASYRNIDEGKIKGSFVNLIDSGFVSERFFIDFTVKYSSHLFELNACKI